MSWGVVYPPDVSDSRGRLERGSRLSLQRSPRVVAVASGASGSSWCDQLHPLCNKRGETYDLFNSKWFLSQECS
jgi:hypothetical protein